MSDTDENDSGDTDKDVSPLEEARMWARHGYEIGQRSCTWFDYGVAPAWLTEGYTNEDFTTKETNHE